MPTHVTEVPCHSISGLKQSFNYMCSRTYYLIRGHLVCHLSLRRGGEVRSNFSFPLPYKHVWTLLYTYRVLISPIGKSSEQQNNKTNQNTTIFHDVKSGSAVVNPRMEKSSSQPCYNVDMPRCGVNLRCGEGSLGRGVGPR